MKPFIPYPKKLPVLLEGKAYTDFKKRIHAYAKGHCEKCGRWVPLKDSEGKFDVFVCAHLCHKVRRKKGGDIPENVFIACFDCHIQQEHGLRWSK